MEINNLYISAFDAHPDIPFGMGEAIGDVRYIFKTNDPVLLNRDLLGEFE